MGRWDIYSMYILYGVYPFNQGGSQLYASKCPVCVLQNLENPISMVQIKWDEVAPSSE